MKTTITHVPYVIKTNGAITMYLNGESATVATDHPNYQKIMDSLKNGQFDLIDNLVNLTKSVIAYTEANLGDVKIENGVITYGGTPLNTTLTSRILTMMAEGFKFDHMVKFLENLLDNPSKRAVEELYTFLENRGLPITDDGCFLAYKAVGNDYMDIHSGTVRNQVGDTPAMPRNLVDDEYGKDCSHGLHVGALDYVTQYGHFVKGEAPVVGGNRLLIVKVNPADVVSVPKYEHHPKMRVCRYTVINEITDIVKELDKIVYKSDGSELPADSTDDDYKYDDELDDIADEAENAATPPTWNGEVDTTSPWNADSYLEGYDVGMEDLSSGAEYGKSRDFSRENSYRIGYNDAYNERPDKTIADDLTNSTPDSSTTADDDSNSRGQPQQADATTENNCTGKCPCGCGGNRQRTEAIEKHTQAQLEAEYTRGYIIGEGDAARGANFSHSLDDDDSTTLANGYSDGYDDYFSRNETE